MTRPPIHLYRFGGEKCRFACYTYSNERNTYSILSDDRFTGKPEDALLAPAAYLD